MLENGGFTGKSKNEFDDGSKMEDINEDDPRLVDKQIDEAKREMVNFGFEQNVPMEDAPDLVDKSFGEFVDDFLRCAGEIYKTLEAGDHKSQYMLYGNFITVEIKRLPCEKGKINGRTNNSKEN